MPKMDRGEDQYATQRKFPVWSIPRIRGPAIQPNFSFFFMILFSFLFYIVWYNNLYSIIKQDSFPSLRLSLKTFKGLTLWPTERETYISIDCLSSRAQRIGMGTLVLRRARRLDQKKKEKLRESISFWKSRPSNGDDKNSPEDQGKDLLSLRNALGDAYYVDYPRTGLKTTANNPTRIAYEPLLKEENLQWTKWDSKSPRRRLSAGQWRLTLPSCSS